MKILLVGKYFPDGSISIDKFSNMLKGGLVSLGHEVKLISPEQHFCRFKQSNKGIAKWLGYIDKLLLFPFRFRKELVWADIVHICDYSGAYLIKYLRDKKHLVTCNDLLAVRCAMGEFKQHSTGWLAKLFVESLLKWLGLAKYIVCISKATRDDLLRISKVVKPDNASVIYMGLNYNYYPADIKESESCLRKLGLKTNLKFFLHVGKDNWYKNRMGLLDIFRNIIEIQDSEDFHLVFAGKDLSTNMVKYITKYKLTNKVISLEGIDNEALRCLYSSAVALIFPSFAEGFGWPIIEAQACGCPVFTSKLPPMTEVGGAAAVYFDPNATKEAARVILEGISDRENLRVRGFENIKRFTAEKMIQEYESVYRKEMTKI